MTAPAWSGVRVVVDATAGARRDCSGIGRYVHGIVRALAARREAPPFELGVRLSKWRGRSFLPQGEGRPLRARLVDDRLDWWLLRRVDLFHGLDVRITRSRRPVRVATLHDLFSFERNDLADAPFRAMKQAHYKRLADEADAIVCVSRATEERFLSAFPRVRGRTTVVHHGIAERFRRADAAAIGSVRRTYRLLRPFLLFVGLLSTRKNLLVLLDAFAELARRRDDVDLVLAGQESHGFAEIGDALARHPFAARVRKLGFVAEADLPALYSAAELFVLPSLSEGFGLPVLEAFACGTPVVASNLPVLHEIGAGELLYADSKDPSALAATLAGALDRPPDAERRARLAARAAPFTWSAAAERTLAVWQEALARRPRGLG